MIWLLIVIVGLREVHSFAAYPPPRFDTFSERIIGKWNGNDEVEEVMRTCGGAVQGIRELELFSSIDHGLSRERPYHNRANDGFIYFDCGSYSTGSVNLDTIDGEKASDNFFMTSLTLHKMPLRRTVLTTSISIESFDSTNINIESRLSKYVSITRGGSEEDFESNNDLNHDPQTETPEGITWNDEIICRMPSAGQTWMLQRVKWEQFKDSEEQLLPENNAENYEVIGWNTLVTRDNQHFPKYLFNSEQIRDYFEKECSIILQMGAICKTNNYATAIVRGYDNDGKLKSVVMQSGNFDS